MKNLRLTRIKKGVRIENMAKELHITRQYMYLIEKGASSPDPVQAKKISEMLGCDFGKLELYNKFPSSKRLDIKDYIAISRNLGYPTDLENLF